MIKKIGKSETKTIIDLVLMNITYSINIKECYKNLA